MSSRGEELAMEPGAVSKGKRTKRQRLLFLTPPPLAIALPSTSSPEFSTGSTTEEEEDLANCLILLAQGRALDSIPNPEPVAEKFTSRRFAEATTTTTGKAGFYVYECKTCNKCFSSFQALGGHRASHKKPKLAANNPEEKKVSTIDHGLELSMNSFMPPVTTTKSKIHECSICGSEFSSGQALGGHMRRHRPVSVSDSPDAKKERNLLSLDLNLPAPSEDDRGSEFSFSGKQLVMFSASSLVDCHY